MIFRREKFTLVVCITQNRRISNNVYLKEKAASYIIFDTHVLFTLASDMQESLHHVALIIMSA